MGATIKRYLIAAIWVYYTLLLIWAFFHFLTGDRYPVFALLNVVAHFFFIPLPIAALVAILTRRRELWLGLGLSMLVFVILWGRLFLPKNTNIDDAQAALVVMTYNVFADNHDIESQVDLIRDIDADVVFIQELDTRLAGAIEKEFADLYPYRVLDPVDNATGMGMISKFPMILTEERLPLNWVGTPQILKLEWEGREMILVNFHMWATGLARLDVVEMNFRAREAQALYLLDFARTASWENPVIVAGDANTTSLSDVHRMLRKNLVDSWMEAGFGMGHTYPGRNTPGEDSPQLYGIPVPRWLARIDYVFHSDQLRAVNASLAPYDGVSDHRAVVVTLVPRE